jgi:hypothetical protein
MELAMKAKVTEQGVLIPKRFLEGVDEVEIRQEQHAILVLPIISDDPILQLGTQPIVGNEEDASVQHDATSTTYEHSFS